MLTFKSIFLLACLLKVNGQAPVVKVTLDVEHILRKTDSRFIGVAIDSGVIRHNWETFDPSSAKIQTLARGLSPCYLRVGGTDADFLVFKRNGGRNKTHNTSKKGPGEVSMNLTQTAPRAWLQRNSRQRRDIGYRYIEDIGGHDLTNYTMTGQFFDELYKFAQQADWSLVFDLNVLLRKDGKWDSTNALELMNYVVEKGYKMAGWELGNEPNAFYHLIKIRVEADQLANDYKLLQKTLSRFAEFSNGIVLGPSTTGLKKHSTEKYYASFLLSGGAQVVTAASFHQYYVDGRLATIDQFYDPDVLNVLIHETSVGVNITRASGSTAQVWLGETSSAWGGGAKGLSDRFVAGFMWLDKLGISARTGIDVVIRQSFYGGHYALIDKETFEPHTDYWLTLMYNLLVGQTVLNVTSPDSTGTLRIYAHCTNTARSGYNKGSIVFYMMNLGEQEVNVTFPQFPASTLLHAYHLTPLDGNLVSQTILLNGTPLKMIDDNTLPDLQRPIKVANPVLIPSRIFSFIVLPDVDISPCK